VGTYNSASLIDSESTLLYDSSTGELRIKPTNIDAYITFYNNTTQHGSVGYDYNNSYLKMNYGAITNAHICINSGGYVGIGAVYAGSTYMLYVTGQIYATANITANSDVREKKILGLFQNGLGKLMGINPIIYEKKELPGTVMYGFSAQEVHSFYPKIGTYDPDKDRYGIDIMGMTAWNTVAIKELKTELDLLKERVHNLEISY
jgi:hypothetical protein